MRSAVESKGTRDAAVTISAVVVLDRAGSRVEAVVGGGAVDDRRSEQTSGHLWKSAVKAVKYRDVVGKVEAFTP